MISIDLLVVSAVMLIVFFRHAAVYKDPNKINYSPIVLALGIVGTLLHLAVYGGGEVQMALLTPSLLPVGLGVVLSTIMSVMNQSVWAINADEDRSKIISLSDDIDALKTLLGGFDQRLEHVARMEDSTHEQLRSSLKEEIEALSVIGANQKHFIAKIESLLAQQHSAMEKFEEFTLTELPGLDNVVHRHIDLLRIAEQDHFNQLKHAVKVSFDEQKQLQTQLSHLEQQLRRIAAEPLGESAVKILHHELGQVIHDFARQMQLIGSKSEAIVTTLQENDAILKASREQSELIMQQMVLSSKQMRELTTHSKELSDSLKPLGKLFVSAETLHQEFIAAKGKLSELVVVLESYERQDTRALREQIERALFEMTSQLRILTHTLEKNAQNTAAVDTQNIQELASKVRLHKSYAADNQE